MTVQKRTAEVVRSVQESDQREGSALCNGEEASVGYILKAVLI